jgi:hypothetical protein
VRTEPIEAPFSRLFEQRLSKLGQGFRAAVVDLEKRELVASCRTPIDDDHWLCPLRLVPDETQARHYGQRRTQDHQDVSAFHEPVRSLDPGLRYRLAEEHHIGFERSPAAFTTDQPEPLPVLGHCIAVRAQFGMLQALRLVSLRVRIRQTTLQFAARRTVITHQTHHGRDVTMQVDHAPATRCRMQTVDVLGDHSGESSLFQIGEGAMSGIRLRVADATPTEIGPGPITALRIS